MYGWTEFDLVRIEQAMKERQLSRDAMMPKLPPRRPFHTALIWIRATFGKRHPAKQRPVPAPRPMVTHIAES